MGTITPFLGKACHRFTGFRPPHHMNVKKFFGHIIRHKKRQLSRLCLLCLRATTLNPWHSSQSQVTDLLILAAKAAKRLHQLRVLEIWDARDRSGHLFRFRQDECRATITLQSTHFILERRAIKAWEETLPTHRLLTIERIPFSEAGEDGSGFKATSMIRRLSLRKLAFDPIIEARLMAQMGSYSTF